MEWLDLGGGFTGVRFFPSADMARVVGGVSFGVFAILQYFEFST